MPSFLKNLMGSGFSAGQTTSITGTITRNVVSVSNVTYPLQTEGTEFTAVPANSRAQLPAMTEGTAISPGDRFYVFNRGGIPILIFPPTGGRLATGGVNGAIALNSGKSVMFIAGTGGTYYYILSA